MWSFQQNIYKTKTVESEPPELFSFTIPTEGSTARIGIGFLSGDNTYDIDWGDGSSIETHIGAGLTSTHNYGSSASRTITITYLFPKEDVYSLRLENGTFNLPITYFNQFTSLQVIRVAPSATGSISGDIVDLTVSTLISLVIYGSTTITGDIASFVVNQPSLQTLNISGSNTLYGNIEDIVGISDIQILGSNIISGNLSLLDLDILSLWISGNNTISGNLSGLTSNTNIHTINVGGNNTITGTLSSFPLNVTYINIGGNNTISGDLITFNSTILDTFIITGNNTISGNIEDFQEIRGTSTRIPILNIGGNNTISGDIGNYEPNNDPYRLRIILQGNNTISNYTSNLNNWNNINILILQPFSGGLSTLEVDQLLIDLDSSSIETTIGSEINLTGTNASRSSSSDTAVASLISKGFDVITN